MRRRVPDSPSESGHARPVIQPGQAGGSGDGLVAAPPAAPAAGVHIPAAQAPATSGAASSGVAANSDHETRSTS